MQGGAHSLSVTGSTGENISMSDDEQKKIIECNRALENQRIAA